MVFNSLVFIIFFATVFLLHNLPFPWTIRKLNLLVVSYLFYAAWHPVYLLLLWMATLVDWLVTRGLAATGDARLRRLLLFASLAANLGLLGTFKYAGFFTGTFNDAAAFAGFPVRLSVPGLILPIGISFYTFVTLSYMIDVYRGVEKPCRSLLDFALYVGFFPHMIAGPIVRSHQLLPQIRLPRRATAQQVGWGLTLFLIGLFEKRVLADILLAPIADKIFSAGGGPMSPLDAWGGSLAFSGQIFCDFAGYSLCAIGTAACLGFTLPANFRFPYAALGFADFWSRWHITLSAWLRDYLWMPLTLAGAQSRFSSFGRFARARMVFNLMVTMLLGGLWHGASWTFVIWGGLHGLFLIAERVVVASGIASMRILAPIARPLGIALTFIGVTIAWILFRARDLTVAGSLIESLFRFSPGGLDRLMTVQELAVVGGVMSLMLFAHWKWRDRTLSAVLESIPRWAACVLMTAMLFCVIFLKGESRAFLYFQF